MRDYDQERQQRHEEREKAMGDRTFRIGGEIFTSVANVSVDALRRISSTDVLTGESYIDAIEARRR